MIYAHKLSPVVGRSHLTAMPDTDYASLKVVDLKELCRGKGLPVSGKKADLIERLEQSDKQAEPIEVRVCSVVDTSGTSITISCK